MRTSTWILMISAGWVLMIAGCSKPNGDASNSAPQGSASASSPSDQADVAIKTTPEEVIEAVVPTDEAADPLSDQAADPLTTNLSVGDLAPELRVGGWALNEPENGEAALANGKVRVVEFWATWCGPCLVSMPHLSELATKYRDSVTVVGITDEDEATVEAFLDQPSKTADRMPWRDLLSYPLAFDDNRYLGEQLFSATGQRGIPAAFIIGGDGYLLWYGHPMTMDDPLEQIVAGTWNAANAVAKMEEIEKAKEDLSRLITALMSAQRDADWDRALAVLDELVADESRAAMLGPNAVLMRYEMLTRGGKSEQARVMADEIRSQRWDDANFLGAIAWEIATRYPNDTRDLDFAMQAASLRGGIDQRGRWFGSRYTGPRFLRNW